MRIMIEPIWLNDIFFWLFWGGIGLVIFGLVCLGVLFLWIFKDGFKISW